MPTAIAVFLFGCGLVAAGLLWAGLYDIGILFMFLGLIGIGIRTVDWLRWLRS